MNRKPAFPILPKTNILYKDNRQDVRKKGGDKKRKSALQSFCDKKDYNVFYDLEQIHANSPGNYGNFDESRKS